jgi:hypothetical protein
MSQPPARMISVLSSTHNKRPGVGGLIEGGRTFKSTMTPLPPYTTTTPPVHLFAGDDPPDP